MIQACLGVSLILSLIQADAVSLTVRGKAVQAAGPAVVMFRSTDGRTFRVKRTQTSESLFVDTRMRALDLEVSGRFNSADQDLDVIQIRSIHDGKLYDAHYWCETCRIRAAAPGPCWCCFQPFEFRETLIEERK